MINNLIFYKYLLEININIFNLDVYKYNKD